MGGNNARTEKEELKGLKGNEYKIKNRSNKSYKIIDEDISKLSGQFDIDEKITITYEYIDTKPNAPESVELVPETMRLSVGEQKEAGYNLAPPGDYDIKTIDFEMVENANVANINGKVIIGREIGFGMMRVTVTGEDWEITGDGAVIVSGANESGDS